jgi:hypothetical protein
MNQGADRQAASTEQLNESASDTANVARGAGDQDGALSF